MKKSILALCALILAAAPAFAGDVAAGKAKFEIMCAACHGLDGKGDGPAGAALNPKPRDYTDPVWQKKTTDEHIKKVIKSGGTAVGLSPMMPALGAAMSDAEIDNLLAYIRSFVKK